MQGGSKDTTVATRTLTSGGTPTVFTDSIGSGDVDILNDGSNRHHRIDELGNYIGGSNHTHGSMGADLIQGSGSNDYLEGTGGDDVIHGGGGNDWIVTGAGKATVTGDDGADSIFLGIGEQQASGGSGDDTIIAAKLIVPTLGTPPNPSQSDSQKRFDNVGFNNFTWHATANSGPIMAFDAGGKYAGMTSNNDFVMDTSVVYDNGWNVLGWTEIYPSDTSGDKIIRGEAGNDLLRGGSGNDQLDGGDDNDSLEGVEGNDTLLGGIGDDMLLGGSGNDYLDAGSDNDRLMGEYGNDTLVGGAGNDYLDDNKRIKYPLAYITHRLTYPVRRQSRRYYAATHSVRHVQLNRNSCDPVRRAKPCVLGKRPMPCAAHELQRLISSREADVWTCRPR